jgi:S-adenosyl-L-methionine hydrolase (adenosine-forming)
MRPNSIITLTSDFGLADSYVGTMKGVILSIAPHAQLIDITHDIGPQDIHQAAYIIQTFCDYFPSGTIHLIVVDPGVGSQRRAITFATPSATFVAPDNGVLTYVWRDALERWGADEQQVYELTEQRFWLKRISSTFHGRDIFAPVVAHLANGVALSALGPRIAAPIEAALEQPVRGRDGGLVGRIIHVDHFGNCITNITPHQLQQAGVWPNLTIDIIDQHIVGLCRTYIDGPVGALSALIGSSDHLELCVRNGNAAQTLGVSIGDIVRIH